MKPIRAIHMIATWLVLAIGVVHTVGTFFFYSDLSEAAIWFAGAGLGGIFIAFLNMGLWHTASPSLSRGCAAWFWRGRKPGGEMVETAPNTSLQRTQTARLFGPLNSDR
jgi:hypothetical protein